MGNWNYLNIVVFQLAIKNYSWKLLMWPSVRLKVWMHYWIKARMDFRRSKLSVIIDLASFWSCTFLFSISSNLPLLQGRSELTEVLGPPTCCGCHWTQIHLYSFMQWHIMASFAGFLCYTVPILSSSLKFGGRIYDLLTLAPFMLPKPLLCGLHCQVCWPA